MSDKTARGAARGSHKELLRDQVAKVVHNATLELHLGMMP
jgi:hypothetical protein